MPFPERTQNHDKLLPPSNRSPRTFTSHATRDDLDPELVADFLRNCRSGSNQLSRIHDDDELLWRMGVRVGTEHKPSAATTLE